MTGPSHANVEEDRPPSSGTRTASLGSVGNTIATLADEYLLIIIALMIMVRPFISGRTFEWSNTWLQIGWFACAGIWLTRCTKRDGLPFKHPLAVGLMAGFVAICAVTFATSVSVNETYRGLCEMAGYLVAMYLAMHAVRDWRSARTLIAVIVMASVLVSLYGYLQRVVIFEFTRQEYLDKEELYRLTLVGGSMAEPFWQRMQSNRVFSTFLHAGSFAGYLVVCIPLTFGLMAGYRRLWHLAGYAAAFTLQLTALLLTATRGAWLALALSSCAMAAMVWHDRQHLRGRVRPVAIALVAATVLAVGLTASSGFVARLYAPPAPPTAPEVAEAVPAPEQPDLSGITPGVQDLIYTGSFVARVTYWQAALRMFAARPVLGMGWNTFGRVYPKYMSLGGYPSQLAHNDYLQVLAETGLVGAALYAAFWLVTMVAGTKLCLDRETPLELRWLRVGIYCAIASFLLHSLVDFDLYIPGIALYVFFLAGLMLGTAPREPRMVRLNWAKTGIGIAVLAFAVGFCFCPYQADRMFGSKLAVEAQVSVADTIFRGGSIKAQNAAMLLSPEEIELFRSGRLSRKEQIGLALARLDTIRHQLMAAQALYRFDSKFPGYLGVIDHIAAHSLVNPVMYADSAIRHYQRALELSPQDATLHQLLARSYIERGNYAGDSEEERRLYYGRALEQFQAAADCYPTNPNIWTEWGQMYIGLGQEEKGREYIEKADRLRQHFRTT